MSSYSKALWLLLSLVSCAALGCSSSRRCGGVELCNERDDDCDGRIDEGIVDSDGRYTSDDNCGRCGVVCDAVLMQMATTCDASQAEPICRLLSCPPGFHMVNSNSCVPDQTVLCLPCDLDQDCDTKQPGSKCITQEDGRRCGQPCGPRVPCPRPFECDVQRGQCVPTGSICACNDVSETVEVACLAQGSVADLLCAGVATCSPKGLGACTIASQESCDGEDDDCDGLVDEDFVDAQGRYVGRLHCGECGSACSPPGENYEATCLAEPFGPDVRCDVACKKGFVDVDKILGNGCECQRFDGSSAPAASGGDNDCDGRPDDDSTFIHVSTVGNDNGPGTRLMPLRTIQTAVGRALFEQKAVLVAQGSYPPFSIADGVSVFGGYRTDFRARDPALYPVTIEHSERGDGAPVLTCQGVHGATVIEGLTLLGADASSPGMGSTTVRFDDCGPAVTMRQVVVLAGRGADGLDGNDAAARLPAWARTLADFDGRDGSSGTNNNSSVQQCLTLPGGASPAKQCGADEISGGGGGAAACAETNCENGKACANAGCTDFTNSSGVCDFNTVLSLAIPNPRAGDGRGLAPGTAGPATYNAPTNRGDCSFCDDNPTLPRLGADGANGRQGQAGAGGFGCSNTTIALDPAGRGSSRGGFEGTSGQNGSGGGGGSAGNGYDVIRGTNGGCNDIPGGSGGAGGSGGCGAPSGGAGQGGGASVGIAVRPQSDGMGPSFEEVRIVTASGGRGGDGGIGAAGGRAGLGAPGGQSNFWCARSGGRGGDGGEGGAGGGGGGGCGGASHAVLFASAPLDIYRANLSTSLQVEQAGVSGQGGRGGFSPGTSGGTGTIGSDAPIR